MTRVQTADGQWYTLPHYEAPLASLMERRLIEVVPGSEARKREWVNPAHIVRVVQQEGDA